MTQAQTVAEPFDPQTTWNAVDRYFERLLPEGAAQADALPEDEAAAQHAMAPNQGMFLQLLVRLVRARRVLEIGTVAGSSTIWLARALPKDGELITLEANPQRAELARANIERARLQCRNALRIGRAIETLPAMVWEKARPFDLIFITADKANNPGDLNWMLKLTRPGTLIVAENVVRDGAVADGLSEDPNVLGVRHFIERMATEPRLMATAMQTVGSRGYDGFAMALVLDVESS
jgi:predicted O-methyltransferase YrrM